MSDAPVLFSEITTAGGHRFGRATLNAPGSLNALSLPMVDLLDTQLRAWATDPQIAGVWLDAVGDKAFCAGGDVVGLYHAIKATPPGQVPTEAAAFFECEYRLDHLIHTYPKPFVCWGHGIVMGGGIGLMAGASHRVATLKTRLAMPEITIGLYPDVGGSWFLARLPGGLGEFLALTGASLNAADALAVELADFALRHEDQGTVLHAIEAAAWQGDAGADRAALSRLLQAKALTPDALPASPVRQHLGRIRELMGRHQRVSDLAVGLSALSQDPDPWLAQAGSAFAKGSPSSAQLALALQRRLRHASLAEVFRLEWQASVGCCMHPDFPEGVRALLVDKDKQPRWQPATLDALDEAGWHARVDAHLQPHGVNPLADLR
ncbi:MAG: enoyl-CoA hydratase/isomerase family protein [Pseudomonadota bacterium]|nr:enoyl-CoA hydratase/isomerase family protein [Pseudomonadota bacterium]